MQIDRVWSQYVYPSGTPLYPLPTFDNFGITKPLPVPNQGTPYIDTRPGQAAAAVDVLGTIAGGLGTPISTAMDVTINGLKPAGPVGSLGGIQPRPLEDRGGGFPVIVPVPKE